MELVELTYANVKRDNETFGHEIENKTIEHWMMSVYGELGELANKIKKMNRADNNPSKVEVTKDDLGEEAADVLIYLDIVCIKLGINLQHHLVRKFNLTSDKYGSSVKLSYKNDRTGSN